MPSTSRPPAQLDKCACGGWKYTTEDVCVICRRKRESREARRQRMAVDGRKT